MPWSGIGALPSTATREIVTRGPAATSTTRAPGSPRHCDLGPRSDLGLQVALVPVNAFEERLEVGQAREREGLAELLLDRVAQPALGNCDLAPELDPADGAGRDKVVGQRHAACHRRRRRHRVFEAAEADEVRDGLAHRGRRERRADPRLQQVHEDGVSRRASFNRDRLRNDGLAQRARKIDLGAGATRSEQAQNDRRQGPPAARHQKTYLTRTSSA